MSLSGERIDDLELQQPLTWFDYAIEWILAATLLFTPMAFGTTEAWSQQIFFAAVTLMALLLTGKLVMNRQTRFVWTWAYVPMIAYLLLVGLSIIPLPAGVLNVISPGTVAAKAALLADLPNAAELTARTTISWNPRSTEYSLRTVAALSVMFVIVVNIFRTPQQIKRLLAMVAIAGTAVAVLALAQDLTFSQGEPIKVFWYFEFDPQPHPRSGPFMGHAMLGQYLNLALGALIALGLVQIGETFRGEDLTSGEFFERLGEPGLRVVYLILCTAVVVTIAMLRAVSFGAIIGFCGAGLVLAVLIMRKRGWRERETVPTIAILTIAALIAAGGLAYLVHHGVGRSENSTERSVRARMNILRQAPAMVLKWPVMGTGLESFEWVYPMFQSEEDRQSDINDRAENDYLQTLTDTGIVGGLITAAFLGIMAVHWTRAYRGRLPIHLAAIGIAFSLTAVLIHEFADFAQRSAGIALVTCVLLGATVSLARLTRPHTVEEAAPNFAFHPMARLALGVLLLAPLGWAMWTNHAVFMGEKFYYVSDPTYTGKIDASDPKQDTELAKFFQERIDGCEQALKYDPQALLYIVYLNEFRWRTLSRRRDEKTWEIVYPPDAKEQARRIVDDLVAARAIGPSYGRLSILQGKVQWELLDKAEGKRNLERGRNLLPIDSDVNFYLAEVAAAEGRWDDAVEYARASFFRAREYDRFMQLLVRQHRRSDLALRVFEDDVEGLMILSGYLPADEVEMRRRVADLSIAMLEKSVKEQPNNGPEYATLARHYESVGRKSEAADALARALHSDYSNIDWRLTRARLLRDLGKREEALAELDIIRRIRPHSDEAKAMQAALMSPRGQ